MNVEDVFAIVVIYTFAAVACVLPLYVIVRSIINFMRASDGLGTIVMKAVVSLIAWLFITSIFAFIPIMFTFEPGTTDRAVANRNITIISVVLTIFYIVIGAALAYWVRLQPGWRTLRKSRNEA
ncbi:MAG TPA: hypothetical protein VGC66_20215 [Pyrinomonadaceae bacterium]|jgi:hypothetical protein